MRRRTGAAAPRRPERAVRVGILGAGYIAGVHARSLRKIGHARIEAICALPRAHADALAEGIGGGSPRTFSSYERMLDEVPLDALFICLPPYAHSGQLEQAARRGIPVFVEKPIALSVERARSMAVAARKAGIVTQVGYHMRFGAAVRKLKALIDDGTAGRPTLFDGRYECNALHGPWWRDRRKSGGQVFEQAIHLYDLAMHLLGTPSSVSAFTANLCHRTVPGYSVEDTSAASIRFSSGALATICASNCAVPGQWNAPCTVICERLSAYLTSHNEATFVFTAGRSPRIVKVSSDLDPYVEEDAAFIAAVQGRRPQTATIDEGLAGIRLVSGVNRSARLNGRTVGLTRNEQ
jgi:predicted dehydrogenase